MTSGSDPALRPRDGPRTHAEAPTAYRVEEDDGVAHSPVSEWEITSGLPDDSPEEDEREEERRLRSLRGRAKATRAIVAGRPGLSETLARTE